MSILTDNIERELRNRGTLIKDFCADIGITTVAYYRWKAGKGNPTVTRMKQIADYLGMTVPELMAEKKTATLSGDGDLPQAAQELIALLSSLDEPSICYLLKKARELAEVQQFRDALE